MRKKIIISIAVALFVLIDAAVLLYPTVSSYFNSRSQSKVVAEYFDDASGIKSEAMAALLEAARQYNQTLHRKPNRFVPTPGETAQYNQLLNTGRDVMGILSIDKLGLQLPIYHGSDESVLQVGLGHMQGTSLPVGGKGSHAFITGHRGLPSSVLLSHLDKIAEGDLFVLHILGEALTYRVDRIETVEPGQMQALDIDENEDFCTLVTCTPYGVNTHRLLVRGRRTENALSGWTSAIAGAKRAGKAAVILLFLLPVVLLLIPYGVVRCRKIQRGGIVRP